MFGNASYSLYLTHLFSQAAVNKLAHALAIAPWMNYAAGVVGAILVALAAHLWIEVPLTRRLTVFALPSRRPCEAVGQDAGPCPPRYRLTVWLSTCFDLGGLQALFPMSLKIVNPLVWRGRRNQRLRLGRGRGYLVNSNMPQPKRAAAAISISALR